MMWYVLLGGCCVNHSMIQQTNFKSLNLKKQQASFSFYPVDKEDSSLFFKNRFLSLKPNLIKNKVKPTIDFNLGFGFADSISLFVNGNLLQNGFFISDYPGTGYYARLTFQTTYHNEKLLDSIRLTIIQHWHRKLLDTTITTRYKSLSIGDDSHTWLLGFH